MVPVFTLEKCETYDTHSDIYDTHNDIYDLRTKKYQSMLSDKINNIMYVKYEDLLADHWNVIRNIQEKFSLSLENNKNSEFEVYNKRDWYLQREYMTEFDSELQR